MVSQTPLGERVGVIGKSVQNGRSKASNLDTASVSDPHGLLTQQGWDGATKRPNHGMKEAMGLRGTPSGAHPSRTHQRMRLNLGCNTESKPHFTVPSGVHGH